MSPIEIEELKNQLNDHLYKGFIRPRIYPLGAPVLFIWNNDGSLKMYINYWQLNQVMIKN